MCQPDVSDVSGMASLLCAHEASELILCDHRTAHAIADAHDAAVPDCIDGAELRRRVQ